MPADKVYTLGFIRSQRAENLVFGHSQSRIKVTGLGFGAEAAVAGMEIYLGAKDIASSMMIALPAELYLDQSARIISSDVFIESNHNLINRFINSGSEFHTQAFHDFSYHETILA